MNFRAEVCVKARTKRKRAKNHTQSGGKQLKRLGLVQEETLVVLYTRMPRATLRRTWNEVEIHKKFSSGSKHLLQYRKWKTQTD